MPRHYAASLHFVNSTLVLYKRMVGPRHSSFQEKALMKMLVHIRTLYGNHVLISFFSLNPSNFYGLMYEIDTMVLLCTL